MIVCDEIINCLNLGLLDEDVVKNFVSKLPKNTHFIFTGRHCPDWLKEKADLISEIRDERHYFNQGKKAIEGLDF